MTEEDILSDSRLCHRDTRVYGIMACARRGPFVTIGERRISHSAHCDRRDARASIAKLIECGFVERLAGHRGERARYRLTSRLFATAAGSEPQSEHVKNLTGSAEATKPEVRCPKCRQKCKQVLKSGMCRHCRWEIEVGRVASKIYDAREEVAKTA